MRLIPDAARRHGYRLAEIAEQLGAHDATVSRRLAQAEQSNV
jgi:DNA-binding IclR family transcriptional regulator